MNIKKSMILARLTSQFAKGKSSIACLKSESYADKEAAYELCNSWTKLNAFIDHIIELNTAEHGKIAFFGIDSLTTLDSWFELVGTYQYMKSTQGKNFNTKLDLPMNGNYPIITDKDGKKVNTGYSSRTKHNYLKPSSEHWQTVYSLANGYGYRWGRYPAQEFIEKIETLNKVGCRVIILAHSKLDRFSDAEGRVVDMTRLDAVSGISAIFAKKVDALAFLTAKGTQRFLNFKPASSDFQSGTRYDYLDGQKILISEKKEEGIEVYWEKIYKDYTNK